MKLTFIVPTLLLCSLATGLQSAGICADTTFRQSEKLSLKSARPNALRVPLHGKFELAVDLSATYENPFDPDQIDLYGIFTSPQGRKMRVNGFLYQPFKRALENGKEQISPAGEPRWLLRFAPMQTGVWKYSLFAKDRSGTVATKTASFTAVSSTNPGVIGLSKRNPRMFAFAGEKPYFPIGENMCWGEYQGTYEYDKYLPKLSAAGGNWIRIWMATWNHGLEWSPQKDGHHGLGVYNLKNAWRLDTTLDIAEKNNVYAMLCFGNFGDFTTGGTVTAGEWAVNPYNAANGGPCATPEEFWTNARARKLYRQRLRYIAARYGYRNSIQSWELWNETWAPAPWVKEMAQYLKGTGAFKGAPADPFGHLVTTTFGKSDVWSIPEIDFSQSHLYGEGNMPDLSLPIIDDAAAHTKQGKPHMMAEFGIDFRQSDASYDPTNTGVNLHDGMWSAALSGNAGTAMIWWWDKYVDGKNMYHHYRPIAQFASGVNWTQGPWRQLKIGPVTAPVKSEQFDDLMLGGGTSWGKAPINDFTVGSGSDLLLYPSYLYSPTKADLRTIPTFKVDYPKAGEFRVHVGIVSSEATLRIRIDGKIAQDFKLNAAPPADPNTKPEYKKTTYFEEYKVYQAVFDKEYSVPVPAGKHMIQVESAEGDWINVINYRLTNYRSNKLARVGGTGIVSGNTALVWLHNTRSNWKTNLDKVPLTPIRDVSTVLENIPTGNYTIRWYDTWAGKYIREDKAVSGPNRTLRLTPPQFLRDVAANIEPVKASVAKVNRNDKAR